MLLPGYPMPFRLLLILGGLRVFGPLAIDLYLPAFPAMARRFATDTEHVQLSLSVYVVGLALGQVFYGPVADRFVRPKPLPFGIGLIPLASLGGCGGMVVNRAVVRDLCSPIESARVFSKLMLVMGIAPILAPLAGGWLMLVGGWHSIFGFLTLFSAAFWVLVWLRLPETLPAD